jgi:hypothetical protein
MEKLILVVEKSRPMNFGPAAVTMGILPEADDKYRGMVVAGRTYSEEGFRKWVEDVWGMDRSSSLEGLAEAAAEGGWECYHRL